MPWSVIVAFLAIGLVGWAFVVVSDPVQYSVGRPDVEYSRKHWMFVRMREYFDLTLERT